MKTRQQIWTTHDGWEPSGSPDLRDAQLVLVFGSVECIEVTDHIDDIRASYPNAILLGCSTSGEIADVRVRDDSLVATAIQFNHSHVAGAQVSLTAAGDAHRAGELLAGALEPEGLVHVFVLANGININGSALVAGMTGCLAPHVTITGGLAGDGGRFKQTAVLWNDHSASDMAAAVGFYGNKLCVGYGSLGGWDPFGPERVITRSKGNILYELDEVLALELYKEYLGEHAQKLPAAALLFPLGVRTTEEEVRVVRTILGVDESEQSMTFAGDMPQGSLARLMKANFDRLIDGAAAAASTSLQPLRGMAPELAVLISCVGRKMVLKQRVEEEIEAVRDALGPPPTLTGFYSYGEIAPFKPGAKCDLHNQTMTVTTISEG